MKSNFLHTTLLSLAFLAASKFVHAAEDRSIVLPGQVSDEIVYETDPSSWAMPQRVLPPDYPAREVAAKRSGYVDIDIAIAKSGRTQDIRAISSVPNNAAFEESAREAIKHWKFHVPQTGCRPQESVGNVRIWFDIKDDKGVVSISNRKSAESKSKNSNRPAYAALFANMTEINKVLSYPMRAHRNNAFGEVYALVTLDPMTGTVTNFEFTYSESRPEGYAEDFVDETKIALRLLKANVLPGQEKPLTACLPFVFRTR